MTTSGPYLPSNISLKYPHLEYRVDYATTPYPVIEEWRTSCYLYRLGMVVNARSQNQEAAWKFIALWLNTEPVAAAHWLFSLGRASP